MEAAKMNNEGFEAYSFVRITAQLNMYLKQVTSIYTMTAYD